MQLNKQLELFNSQRVRDLGSRATSHWFSHLNSSQKPEQNVYRWKCFLGLPELGYWTARDKKYQRYGWWGGKQELLQVRKSKQHMNQLWNVTQIADYVYVL